jgi:hypothetical protein
LAQHLYEIHDVCYKCKWENVDSKKLGIHIIQCKGIVYKCGKCGINARNKHNLNIHLQKHERIEKQKEMYRMGMTKCQWCFKIFKDIKSLMKHKCIAVKKWKECREIKNKSYKFRCSKCYSVFSSKDLLNKHEIYCFASINKFNRRIGGVKCHKCQHVTNSWKDLWRHQRKKHQRGGGVVLQPSPFSKENLPPWEDKEGNIILPDLKDFYEKHK